MSNGLIKKGIKLIVKILLAFMLFVILTAILVTPGINVFFSAFWYLFFGFIDFFANVLPKIEFNVNLMIQASICFLGIIGGGHYFLKWLYGNRKTDDVPKVWRKKWTISFTFTIVAVFVSGIAAIGIIHQTMWLSQEKLADQWPTSHALRSFLSLVEIGHENISVMKLQQELNKYVAESSDKYQLLCIPNRDTGKLKAIVVVPRFPREEFDVYTLRGDFDIDGKDRSFADFMKLAKKQSYPIDRFEEIVHSLQ